MFISERKIFLSKKVFSSSGSYFASSVVECEFVDIFEICVVCHNYIFDKYKNKGYSKNKR